MAERKTNTPLLVALYARVSTLNHYQNPEMQLAELREYCARRGWTIFAEYVDRGVSGSKDSRPALNCLMNDAKQRRASRDLGLEARPLRALIEASGERTR